MNRNEIIKLTESPRDAQQGLPYIIPPEKRAAYINALMHAGFDVIDFGSFVSPKAIPQMAEQDKVLELVDKSGSKTRLMAIVGNLRGGNEAVAQPKLDIVGFPYSISETFLMKNINSGNTKALDTIDGLLGICNENGKELRIFMSMAFGNPYGDPWSIPFLAESIEMLVGKGIRTITLADTIGVSSPESIAEIFSLLLQKYSETEFGLHIHTRPNDWHARINAAWQAGCRGYDGVINGIGGCPMTGYEMVGNLDTMHLLDFLEEKQAVHKISKADIRKAMEIGY